MMNRSKGFVPLANVDRETREVVPRSRVCRNPTSACNESSVDGFEFCAQHILYDGHSSKENHCSYVFANNKKCANPVIKTDARNTLCFEHSRQQQLVKNRSTVGKLRDVETNDVMLYKLAHHLDVGPDHTPMLPAIKYEGQIGVSSPIVAAFDPQINISSIKHTLYKRRQQPRPIDYASDSSSDAEMLTLSTLRPDYEFEYSDYESTDSEDEDVFQHTSILSNEEIVTQAVKKASKLQGLYIEEIGQLNFQLREARREFVQDLKKEREVHSSIHDQENSTQEERKQYEQFKALARYRVRRGVEAVLRRKFKEKRLQAEKTEIPGYQQKPTFSKCHFSESGVKCTERYLPASKFCRKHILSDSKQLLFRACGVEKSNIKCQEPVPNIFDDATCLLHFNLPTKRSYAQKKLESDSEDEDIKIKLEDQST